MEKIEKLKIGIYSPYWRIFGGGERYLLAIASYLSENHDVFLYGPSSLAERAKTFFGISLGKVNFLPGKIFQEKKIFNKYLSLSTYDVFFYMTDGSLFFASSRKGFLIVQSPSHLPLISFSNKIKMKNWSILCYSSFMEKIILEKLGKKAQVLPPCIETAKFQVNLKDKENLILTVGRFFLYPHNKKHDFLVKVFKKNYKKCFKDWKLIIAGGMTEEGGKEIINNLKKEIGDFPIEILVNLPFTDLINYYRKAKLYWHAAGFGENIDEHPEKAEHFGITTLEAMASAAVPVVFRAGGQEDIVNDGQNGYFWTSEAELVNKTSRLIQDKVLLETLSVQAKARADDFSSERFYEKVGKIIQG